MPTFHLSNMVTLPADGRNKPPRWAPPGGPWGPPGGLWSGFPGFHGADPLTEVITVHPVEILQAPQVPPACLVVNLQSSHLCTGLKYSRCEWVCHVAIDCPSGCHAQLHIQAQQSQSVQILRTLLNQICRQLWLHVHQYSSIWQNEKERRFQLDEKVRICLSAKWMSHTIIQL